jgi:RNA polymerase sigma-70 factor (sigma-E family)
MLESSSRRGHTKSSRRDREVAALFDQHYHSLRGLAFVMLGDSAQAEEVVMDAFAKAFSRWALFRKVDNPPAYLRQIVVNLCRSKLRRRKIEQRANLRSHTRATHSGWESQVTDREIDVWSAVQELPERQRACVVLRYLEDLTEQQISEVLECPLGTVKSTLARARSQLEKSLGEGVSNERSR